ncbi:MAG TPA: hypothetical protein VN963_08025 [bacterium]|nr:hypothetical protein [bacterium]
MKHAPESRRKNSSKPLRSQGKTIAITGQKPALSGLNENQNAALAILAKRNGKSPDEYLKSACNAILKASIEDVETQLRDGSPEEKKAALSLLRSLPEPFRPSTVHIKLAPLTPGVIPTSLADEASAALDSLLSVGKQAITLLAVTTHSLTQAMHNNEPNYNPLPQWRHC